MGNLWAKKSISQLIRDHQGEEHGLKRVLTRRNLVLLGIGGIIGAGIFVLTGQAAAAYSGPAVSLSFVFASIACAFAGLCYAEFAAMIPISGSAYAYAYATLGEFIAWIIGWDLVLEYLFGAATVAVGWSGYVVSFLADLNVKLPEALVNAPFSYDTVDHSWGSTGAFINAPAILIVLVITALLVLGIRESARFNNVIVLLKIGVILIFVLFGLSYIDVDNWQPFVPENQGAFGQFGWSGVFRATGVIFFAFIGFDAVSTLSQEAKNPQKDMPWGILGSLVVCTVLYVIVGLVMTGMVHYTQLNDAAPIAVAINAAGKGLFWLRPFIKIGAIAGLSSVVLVMLMAQPRILYSMSSDGLLPKIFSKIHPIYQTPHWSTIITGIGAAVVAGLFPIGLLGELVSIGTLLAFAIVSAGILVLRYLEPDIPRPFRAPFFPLVPILGILTSLGVMLTLPGDTWLRLMFWMAAGLIIYFFYGRKHSKLS
jgi:APA family basic amino acid/polyamine antiporter